jgi:hypothetical protein
MCKSLKDLIISQNDSIDIRDCYVQTGIEDIIGQLDAELVGLQGVKTRVREISSVLLFDRTNYKNYLRYSQVYIWHLLAVQEQGNLCCY